MRTIRQEHRHLDVACELDRVEGGARVTEWGQLRARHGLGAEAIQGGARMWLAVAAREAAEDLVGREAACCGFLDLELVDDGDRLRLEITSPASDAAATIASLAGLGADVGRQCC